MIASEKTESLALTVMVGLTGRLENNNNNPVIKEIVDRESFFNPY